MNRGLAVLFLCFAGCLSAQPTVTLDGTHHGAISCGSFPCPVTVTYTAGDSVAIVLWNSGSCASVAASGSNTYSQLPSATVNGSSAGFYSYTLKASGLIGTSDVVTVSPSGCSPTSAGIMWAAVSGASPTDPIDMQAQDPMNTGTPYYPSGFGNGSVATQGNIKWAGDLVLNACIYRAAMSWTGYTGLDQTNPAAGTFTQLFYSASSPAAGSPASGSFTTSDVFSCAPIVFEAITPIHINQANPTAVNQGTTPAFTSNVAANWAMNMGSAGSITGTNTTTGSYTAPSHVTVQQNIGGCQGLPNNSVYNTRIDSLPVDAGTPLTALNGFNVGYDSLRDGPAPGANADYPLNIMTSAASVLNMLFYYTNGNNGPFKFLPFPQWRVEQGWYSQWGTFDKHGMAVERDTCTLQEVFNQYRPQPDGYMSCPTCNAQSGVRYSNATYDIPVSGATDAANMYILPTLLKQAELEAGAINHVLTLQLPLGSICAASFRWPAQTANGGGGAGCIPYGARLRLKSGVTLIGSPTALETTLINQLKQQGLILDDILGVGGTMAIRTQLDPFTYAEQVAMDAVGAAIQSGGISTVLEVVDESSLMLSSTSIQNKNVRETITATDPLNSGNTASVEVVLQGVTVGVLHPQELVQEGVSGYQFTGWVNGTANTTLNWTATGSGYPATGETLSGTGLYTAPTPSTLMSPVTRTVTITSAADGTATASFTLTVWPTGSIRILGCSATTSGCTAPYTDSGGHVWYGSTAADNGFEFSNFQACPHTHVPGSNWDCSIPDILIYQNLRDAQNDLTYHFILPNGAYNLTGKFGVTGSIGTMNVEAQGVTGFSNVDVFAAVGAYAPYDLTMTATVTNHDLNYVLRHVTGNVSVSLAGLQIDPAPTGVSVSGPVTITRNAVIP